jgi:hypothetical protein
MAQARPRRGGPEHGVRPGSCLPGMRERATLYGGSLPAGPRQPAGYQVQATLPFETSRA